MKPRPERVQARKVRSEARRSRARLPWVGCQRVLFSMSRELSSCGREVSFSIGTKRAEGIVDLDSPAKRNDHEQDQAPPAYYIPVFFSGSD